MLKSNDESLQNYPNMNKWDKLDSNKIRIIQEFIEQCEQQQLNYAMFLPHATLEKGVGERQLKQAKILLAQA